MPHGYICASLGSLNDLATVNIAIENMMPSPDILEARLDLFPAGHLENFNQVYNTGLPAITTVMAQDEGGKWQGTEEQRVDYLRKAIDKGTNYITIELRKAERPDIKELIEYAKSKNVKLILADHDFQKTPSLDEIN